MHNIETGYEATVEIVIDAHMEGRASLALASAAWWLGRRNILASKTYFLAVAAKMTNSLDEITSAPLVAQLDQAEVALLATTTDWPVIPSSITSMLAIWNPEPQAPNTATVIRIFSDAIQRALNTKANERLYDSIQSAISYRNDPNPVFAAEAEALFVWRSTVWTYSTTRLSLVLSGVEEIPTVEAFLAGMPLFDWIAPVTDV